MLLFPDPFLRTRWDIWLKWMYLLKFWLCSSLFSWHLFTDINVVFVTHKKNINGLGGTILCLVNFCDSFPLRIPNHDDDKTFHVMKFNSSQKIDFTQWNQVSGLPFRMCKKSCPVFIACSLYKKNKTSCEHIVLLIFRIRIWVYHVTIK